VLVVIDAPDAPASEGPEGRRRLPARPWFALDAGEPSILGDVRSAARN